MATECAIALIGCYRQDEANDPKILMGAIIATLCEYSEGIAKQVTSPVRGLPSRLKWLPSVAEVREACEAEMAPIRREQERRARIAASREPPPVQPREERPTVEELRARCGGENWGIAAERAGRKSPFLTAEQLRASVGMTEAAWAALPDAREPRA